MDIYDNNESLYKLNNFWEQSKVEINNIKADQITFKSQDLPLARIKKIMKLDEDVKTMMISAEAPILFAKAAEFFIRELTLRAWLHTERNKRRTLQRSDITLAVVDSDTDMFDFLIDIVPREDTKPQSNSTKREETAQSQPMHQLSLFNGNQIHLRGQGMSSNQQTMLSGLVDANNLLQVQTVNQNSSQGQQNQQHMQYVFQIPSGTQLNDGQSIQIQMMTPQTMMANNGAGKGTIIGQQQPHMFTVTGGQGNHGTTTMLLHQPNMLTAPAPAPVDRHNNNHQQQQQQQEKVQTPVATTDGAQSSGSHVDNAVSSSQGKQESI